MPAVLPSTHRLEVCHANVENTWHWNPGTNRSTVITELGKTNRSIVVWHIRARVFRTTVIKARVGNNCIIYQYYILPRCVDNSLVSQLTL